MYNTLNDDTIIAPATVPGTGAITLLRISGPQAISIADSLVSFRKGDAASSGSGRVKLGTVYFEGEPLDDVLACIYRAPHSYTGEDSVELMCHASPYIASTLLQMAISLGARMALPGEFTQKAFLNGKMDLTQAEAVADVVASSGRQSHRIALSHLKGGFSAQLGALRERMLKMSALLELELDFSEEDVEFADRKQLLALVDETISKVDSLASSFKVGNAVKSGVIVAIAGEANAGKSTLLNAILGEERAIVSPIPGTTRDTIEEAIDVDGILLRFVDTAGIRDLSISGKEEGNAAAIERKGIERSFDSIRKADIVILILDAVTLSSTLSCCNATENALDNDAVKSILRGVDRSQQKLFVALNKVDLLENEGKIDVNKIVSIINNLVSHIDNEFVDGSKCLDADSVIKISAKTGAGVPNLLKSLSDWEKSRIDAASNGDSVLVTNLRHYEALITSSKHLQSLRNALLDGTPSDLVAEDLRAAVSSLGSITGSISSEDVLGEIFGKFCIGK